MPGPQAVEKRMFAAKTGAFMSKSNRIQLSDHFTTGRLLKFTASPIIMMIFTSIYTIVAVSYTHLTLPTTVIV